jgi:hypothetical protein
MIAKKLMKANITKDFGILVEAKDSCESSATATVLIETQNMVNRITTSNKELINHNITICI